MTTRDQILDAALSLFNEKGFTATSVNAIRESAGVSNGSFFYAFSSKNDVGAALYLRCLVSYQKSIADSLKGVPGAEEGIAAMVEAHVSWVVSETSQAQFLFGQSQAIWMESVRDQLREENEKLQGAIAAWASPLLKSGQLVEFSPEIMGAQLIGPPQIVCRAWLSGRSDRNPMEALEELVAIIQRALLK